MSKQWKDSKAWREGFADAMRGRESKNPYGYSNPHKMMQYNSGYWYGLSRIDLSKVNIRKLV